MLKIMLNYDFLEALIFEYHENHEAANKIVNVVGNDYLYIPSHVLIVIMEKLGNYNHDINIKFLENISMSTRIDYNINKQIFLNACELFKSSDSHTFLDCITIQYMKSKQMKHIISFNEKFDEIKGIKRLYKVDEYNPHRLNFYSYF